MKRRILTLLAVLVVLVGGLAVVGQAATSETLTGNVDSKTITEDTELVMAGYSIGTLTVEKGVTVTLKGMGNGTIGSIEGEGTVVITDTKTTQVKVGNGTYSVEVNYLNFADGGQLILGTAGINLSTDPEDVSLYGASVYYTSVFGGNAKVQDKVAAYGVALGAGRVPNFADKTYTRTDSSWTVSNVEAFAGNGVRLTNIMNTNKAYSLNKMGAIKKIYNVAYVELATGTRITSNPKNICLKDTVEAITADEVNPNTGNVVWDDYSYLSKSWVVQFCETFENVVSAWNLGRLDAYLNNGTYELHTASDIRMMADNPNASYALMANIDMTRMEAINGLVGFTGSIDGNGYTITGLSVNGIALVDTVAAGQSVTDLHLRDVNVVVPAGSKATAVGTIAGTNNGTITGVTASGSVKDTRENVAMGALVGNNAGTLTSSNNLTDSVVVNTLKTDGSGIGSNNTTYATANLAASVGLYNEAEGVKKGLIGEGNNVASAENVYWRDRSASSEGQSEKLQNRRQIVVDDVYEQGTIRWTVPSTMAYYNDQKNQYSFNKGDREWVQTGRWPWQGSYVGLYHIHNQQFNPGTVYNGIPYTHIASSTEQAKFYMTKGADGVYTLSSTIASKVGGSDNKAGNATWSNGGLGWAQYLGSDCSSALALAWHKVSPIRDLNRTAKNKGVSPFYTSDIVPSEFNQWSYGIVKVGNYTVDDAALAAEYELTGTNFTTNDKTQTKTNYSIKTDAIIMDIIKNQGGAQTVYEAYALSKMGDIMVASGVAGHTRMLALDPIVIRNANGVIDAAKSYFVTHEQGDGLYERANTLSSWRINYKYTFEQLAYQNTEGLTGSTGYYLPVTMKAFHDDSMSDAGGITLSGGRKYDADGKSDPSYVVINASFRIQSATMTIMDAPNGNVLYQKTAYQGASTSQNRRRAVPGNVPMYMSEFFSDYGNNLTAGQTYYFTISGTTFTSTTPNNVYTNQAFVYTPAS